MNMKWNQLRNASLEALIHWAESQSWCLAMAESAQDPEWHAEGDVWTHTQRVLHELLELESWPMLSAQQQMLLKFTALLHDVAKPLTTETDSQTGRVSSPKHAVKGEYLARAILRELECDLRTRETICRLVRFHGRPSFLLDRQEPVHEVVRLSWLLNNQLLYLFALADTRGRDTDSLSRPEENLHCWKLLAEEYGCFESPYPFATDHARFTFNRQAEPNLHYVPFEKFTCSVTVLAGLPGSGKDYWLAQHGQGRAVVSLDHIREELDVEPTDNQGEVAQLARERCRELLRSGTSFVFNATNLLRTTRGRWIDLLANYDARIEIVYIEPPLKQIISWNRQRAAAVPENVIRRLADKSEPPTWLECHLLQLLDGNPATEFIEHEPL